MNKLFLSCAFFLIFSVFQKSAAQLIINEGSNRNYSTLADEDNDRPDWIEIYNSGIDTVTLTDYALTDDIQMPQKWTFPDVKLAPHEYLKVFCSSKDRKPTSVFQQVLYETNYTPRRGWHQHTFTNPFLWDGTSSILINVCSYNSNGYTDNSVFNQSATSYPSTIFSFVDGSDASCSYTNGTPVRQRPNIMLNGVVIGTGVINNSPYDYPAPYGNWYWSARNQMIIPANELLAAGLTAGYINSIAFDVASTNRSTVYSYIDFSFKQVSDTFIGGSFTPLNTERNLHTNFSISGSGETVYLFDPSSVLQSSLFVNCINPDESKGCSPDGSSAVVFFDQPTPEATNNNSNVFHQYLQPPVFTLPSGQYNETQIVRITNPNRIPSNVHYTLNGSDPTLRSPLYDGSPIYIVSSQVLKARVFSDTVLTSPLKAASYLIGVSHTTPILSVITDEKNLYGDNGIFDHWDQDWQRPAYAEYFNTEKSAIFSQPAAIQMDGGAGGSRSQPQHSFRLELDNSVLGGGPVSYPLIPDKSKRNKYSNIYLRNGSNQFLTIPYKDAIGVKVLSDETYNYYSGYRPVSVYINGSYFGLYELREKIDEEFFKEAEDADSSDILSLSYWYGSVLRALSGSVDSFYNASNAFHQIDINDPDFWNKADRYFDMQYYTDYIIAQAFIQNQDWPYNNIKIYRSEKTKKRYRFAVIDVELALNPNGWTNSDNDPISFLNDYDPSNAYLNIWQKAIQNSKYKNYFINRFADIMNTSYLPEKLKQKELAIYNEMAVEMPNEYARWGNPNNITEQMTNFNNNHLALQAEYLCRGEKVRNFINADFDLSGQVEVTLDVYPKGAGKIKISTITPETLPWKGIYFNGNPVNIEVTANPGYTFYKWDFNSILGSSDTTKSITVNITSPTQFKALFKETPFGIPANTNNNHFLLYPNPGQGKFSIYLNDVDNGKYDISFCNTAGQVLRKEYKVVYDRNEVVNTDISYLPDGIYFIKVSNSRTNQVIKYLKTSK